MGIKGLTIGDEAILLLPPFPIFFWSYAALPGSAIFFIVARTAGTVAIKRRCLSRNANKVRPFVIDKGSADLKDSAVQRAAWAVDIGSPHTKCGLSPPAVADASAPDISPFFPGLPQGTSQVSKA